MLVRRVFCCDVVLSPADRPLRRCGFERRLLLDRHLVSESRFGFRWLRFFDRVYLIANAVYLPPLFRAVQKKFVVSGALRRLPHFALRASHSSSAASMPASRERRVALVLRANPCAVARHLLG